MGRLDLSFMRHMTKDEFRVLTAVEMGMKNHALVPLQLVASIAKVRTVGGGVHKAVSSLMANRLLHRECQAYEGYRLTTSGYDVLALKALLSRGVLSAVGQKVGVGKESDIYRAMTPSGEEVIIKLHRLGRTSFRAVKRKRDYLRNKASGNWLYLSRLAAMREYAFMRALHAHGFPVPTPKDQNRHIVVMSLVPGFPMYQLRAGEMAHPDEVCAACLGIARRLARHGLVHCDLNEFNLMIGFDEKVTLIDFPQMISVHHANAEELFDRDVHGITKYFAMKQHHVIDEEDRPRLPDILRGLERERRERAERAKAAPAAPVVDPPALPPAPLFVEAPAPPAALSSAGLGLGFDAPPAGGGAAALAEDAADDALPARLDVEVQASGFSHEDEELLLAVLDDCRADAAAAEDGADADGEGADGPDGDAGVEEEQRLVEAGHERGAPQAREAGGEEGEQVDSDGDGYGDGDGDADADADADAGASAGAPQQHGEIMEPSKVEDFGLRRSAKRQGGRQRRRAGKHAHAGGSRAKPNSSKVRSKGRVVHKERVGADHDDMW